MGESNAVVHAGKRSQKINIPKIISNFQLLPSDQEQLLEYSWAQLFVFTAAEWAFPISEGTHNHDFN